MQDVLSGDSPESCGDIAAMNYSGTSGMSDYKARVTNWEYGRTDSGP